MEGKPVESLPPENPKDHPAIETSATRLNVVIWWTPLILDSVIFHDLDGQRAICLRSIRLARVLKD